MPRERLLIEADALRDAADVVVVDCRFSLQDPAAGRASFEAGHIPGACYLDLNRDLSSPVRQHGGRHPLPEAATLVRTLASCGIGSETRVVAYDDSRFGFAARLWWLMRSLGYRQPSLLNGGYGAWLDAGGEVERGAGRPLASIDVRTDAGAGLNGHCDIRELAQLQAAGALLVDSREPRRYQGLEELIDPVPGHIPGAVNHPWQGVTDGTGRALDEAGQRAHWGSTLDAPQLVVYCGSGVTACVNLFSLALLGREDATLYAGSWSDWCSYL
ncbi:sulfurtransferase [Seongchinamella sediminis]|uniref:Sulfurtransferase n=1 Tax=Seongchinamella sediminis TaxID=2283635 RepID=A0A3L7E1T4_9GAMM|nr:sulfurtransferase [Seongchinamella sediminis]RLQ23808.1 sulfurtransferase [Seongchinamella sediminis]